MNYNKMRSQDVFHKLTYGKELRIRWINANWFVLLLKLILNIEYKMPDYNKVGIRGYKISIDMKEHPETNKELQDYMYKLVKLRVLPLGIYIIDYKNEQDKIG